MRDTTLVPKQFEEGGLSLNQLHKYNFLFLKTSFIMYDSYILKSNKINMCIIVNEIYLLLTSDNPGPSTSVL